MFDYLAKYPLEIEILPHINHLEIIPMLPFVYGSGYKIPFLTRVRNAYDLRWKCF